jgi:hypothetical protein
VRMWLPIDFPSSDSVALVPPFLVICMASPPSAGIRQISSRPDLAEVKSIHFPSCDQLGLALNESLVICRGLPPWEDTVKICQRPSIWASKAICWPSDDHRGLPE